MSYKSKPLPLEFCCAATERKLFPEDRGNEIALCGRSNSGKSTLFNKLMNENVLSKNMLFATLDPTRRIFKDYSYDKIII